MSHHLLEISNKKKKNKTKLNVDRTARNKKKLFLIVWYTIAYQIHVMIELELLPLMTRVTKNCEK